MTASLVETPPVDSSASTHILPERESIEFEPPERPSSTPYPLHELERALPYRLPHYDDDSYSFTSTSSTADYDTFETSSLSTPLRTGSCLGNLPVEVHEAILDHLFGYCVSASSRSGMWVHSLTRSWGTALRHSRRREMTDLALVSRTWCDLVQQRLYRHIKIRGSVNSIDNAMTHLAIHDTLAKYVKHVEVWFPVFRPGLGPRNASNMSAVAIFGERVGQPPATDANCSLEEVFRFMAHVVPKATVLTLEGGERKKAPQVEIYNPIRGWIPEGGDVRALSRLDSVKTLVTKGQWNLIRCQEDLNTILDALPDLHEWQGSYSKPKSKSYLTMNEFLPVLPGRLKSVHICLENDYKHEAVLPPFYAKVVEKGVHICPAMGTAATKLEQFAYTGRVCRCFFESAIAAAKTTPVALKSLDLTVKNCCRPLRPQFHDSGSGIQDMAFITAFEELVTAGIRALGSFQGIEFLRIRFVDLGKLESNLNRPCLLTVLQNPSYHR